MKSEVTVELEGKKMYPCLKKYEDGAVNFIVLFSKLSHGTVVHTGTSSYKLGDTSNTWDESGFKDFYGTITLSRD